MLSAGPSDFARNQHRCDERYERLFESQQLIIGQGNTTVRIERRPTTAVRRYAVNPDTVAAAPIAAIPDIWVVERKRRRTILLMQLARVELVVDEINTERRLAVPCPFFADAVLPDRHVALTLPRRAIFAVLELVQC